MDLPPYHHHHHQRYVPRPTNFPHNPNFFHHLPPPPPPQQRPAPPPPPISNLHPPPPPPHHHITQPSLPPPPFHHKSQFPFPSRLSDNPRFTDFPQSRSPPRVSSNHPPYHPPHPHPQNFTYHNPPPPLPPSPRFIVDDFSSNRANDNQLPHWVRRDVEVQYDDDERYPLERRRMVNIDVNSPRDFRELRDDRYERERWEYGGNVDEVSVGSSSRRVSSLDNNANCNDYDDVRFSNRLRVDTEEIHRSPQKEQVQKKSALLRIQCGKPNNRSRNQGSELSSGGVRAKQKDVFERLERRVAGRGEGSQMELDVSFKSNALVAKAIMTPSSSAIDSDRSEIPRAKKIRKVSSSGSPMKRIGNDLGKGAGSANDSGCRSSSKKSPSKSSNKESLSKSSNKESSSKSSNKESKCLTDKMTVSAGGSSSDRSSDSNKDSRHLADKIVNSGGERASRGTLNSNKESKHLSDEATVSVVSSASNSTPLPSSNGVNDLIGVKESKGSPKAMVLDQGSDHVEKFRIPLFIVRKKKKVTNKKVTTPIKVGVNPGNAIHPCLQGENVVELVERTRTDDMTTLEDVNVKLPSDELVSELEKPSELVAVSKDESVEPSNSDGKKASPAEVLVSSSVDSEIHDVADYTSRSVQNGPSTLKETCMIEVQEKRTNFDADNTGNVGGHSEDELRVSKDGPTKESSEAMVCVERNDDVVLSSIDGRKIHKDEVSSSTTDTHISADSELGFSDGKKNAVAAIGSFEAGSVEPSSDRDIVPLLTNIEKGLQVSFLNGNNSSCNSDEAGRIAVVNDLQIAGCLSNSYPRTGTFGGSFESCVDGITLSPETSHTKGLVNAVVSVGDDIRIVVDDDCLPKVTRKRKIMDDESALAMAKISKTEVNEVSSLLGQRKNFSFFREDDASGEEDVTVSGNGTDSLKGNCSHGGPSEVELSFQDCFKDCPNSCSTKSPKKREVSSPAKAECVPSVTTYEGPSSWRITVPLVNDVSVAELESQDTLSNVNDGPLAHPSVIMLESSSTAKDVCQAEPFEDGLVDHFSDVHQVIANNSQLGAVGQETTTSDVSIEMERMADTVSEDKGSSLGIEQKLASKGGESCSYVLDRDDIPLLAENLSLFADKVSVESMESVPDVSPQDSFPEDLPNSSVSEVPNDKSSMSSEFIIEKAQSFDENCGAAYDHISSSVKTSFDTFEFGRSSDHKVGGDLPVNVNTVPLSSQNPVKSTKNVNSQSLKPNLGVNQQSPAGLRVSSVRPSSFITSRNMPVAKKPLTWHRTGNSSSSVVGRYSNMNFLPPQSHLPKDIAKVNSYIRKGNSLVRNPPPVGSLNSLVRNPPPVGSLSKGNQSPSSSIYRLNSFGVNELKKKSENRPERTGSPSCRGSPEVNVPSERPKTPPQIEPFSCITLKSTSSPVVDHPGNGSIATNSDPLEVADDILTLKVSERPLTSSTVPECQVGLGVNSESQNILDEGSSRKSIVYVKQRSNQLVAAPDKTQTSSDGYYKRRTNQLIRASSNIHMKQRVASSRNIVPFQRGMERLSGLAKTSKSSKFSLVWKLGDTQSSRKYGGTVEYEKLWPYLFPWKRASFRRSFLRSSPSDSSSIIRRKLLLSKKRETIYTRSIHGLSLRRSKVLSVSGSSLKWSKSLEQRSKKAAEEAALTVAAVYKRKRGQDGFNADSINGNNVSRKFYCVKLLPGERIFRVGCERYKMDPSGKTLQRISDEEPSVSVPEAKKSYIPKRLLIGNDEYVRVGNGNKLVRNPKRRVRILANEKVRWSLHTARIRLARKKQYCQFFTRFGKCNKDNGKCPYIHDPSKIAVCTKFLNGSCSDTNCKLTHEVIPERMQDCSYFLQGICSNENCPYRHVNVNPNASVCEGFLRGYCVEGNECRKKHTYVCPVFEATGNCPKGSKCKLHHPKNKRKGVKRKASSEMKNVRGRYFGSPHIDISDRITAGPEQPSVKGNNDIFGKEGEFLDFISLGDSDEEEQTMDQRSEETPLCESGPAEMQLDDVDELIKPMRLITRNRSVGSFPYIDSPSNI